MARLHALLLRFARSHLARRSHRYQFSGEDVRELAIEAAGDALLTILSRLEKFRGGSRFTTWACRFVILEAGASLKRRLRTARELPLDPDRGLSSAFAAAPPDEQAEHLELLHRLRHLMDDVLTDRQREVFAAVALNDVPTAAIATQLQTSPGAVYKMLHDAREKLRDALELKTQTPQTAHPEAGSHSKQVRSTPGSRGTTTEPPTASR